MPDIDIYSEPTTLVLGAGASAPYGFPLGPDLKTQILGLPDNRVKDFLKDHANATALIPGFKEALRFGDYGTIDYFLERKKRYRDLGAYYIVTVLAGREHGSALFPQRDLYADIFHMLGVESDSAAIPPLSVVTLNYDRSLEYFLACNVQYNCADEREEIAAKKAATLPIVHAHGSLGDLLTAPYGQLAKDANSIQAAAKRIMIISDSLEDSEDFRRAQEVLVHAKNIVFLGFGYHERTLSALLSRCDMSGKRVFGTAMHLADDRKNQTMLFFHSRIHWGGIGQDCSSFLEHLGIGRRNLPKR
jgi:hypothetical protein